MSQINDFLDKKPTASPAAKNQINAFLDGAPPATPGLIRGASDSAIALGSGVTQGVKMLTDVAGADNAASRALGKATDALTDLESPYRKAEKQGRAEKIKKADESGSTWEQVKAYTGSFADAPLDTTLNAVGTSIPTLAAGLLTGGGAAAGIAARAAQVGIGAAQGVGGIKGQIHESVKQKHLEAGATEADAAQRADAAQAYSGPNAGSIALGGALGAVAGGTGAESAVRRLAGQRVGAGAADAAAPGIVRSAARGVAHETPMEMLQGGQERYASNTALQGEGFDVPTMQGVVGQAALEGLASAPMGGGFGAIEGVARQGVAQRQGEGAAAFSAGEARTPPDSIKSVAAKAQWVRGWDVARAEASASPAPAPAGDVDVSGVSGAQSPQASGVGSTVDVAQAPGAPADTTPSNWETGTSPLAQQIQSSVQNAQDLAAQAMKPSERMGLNADDGAMSTAAVVAVDSGASEQMQAAQQAADQVQDSREPAAKPGAADPETGEVVPAVRAQELQERLQFIEQQARANGGWDMQMVSARDAARAELAALNPSTAAAQGAGARAAGGSSAAPAPTRPAAPAAGATDPAPSAGAGAADPGLSAGEQIAQLETAAANAQARAADWSSREYKPNSKPLPKYEAAGGPADVQEANEQRRLKEIAGAKTAASSARAQAETLRQQGNVQAQQAGKAARVAPTTGERGAKVIAQEGAARRAREEAGSIPPSIEVQDVAPAAAASPGASKKGPANVAQAPQAQQAKAQQPQAGGTPTARPAAAPGLNDATTTVNDGAQAAAPAGPKAQASGETGDQRAQRGAVADPARRAQLLDASERWTRMTTAERQALAQRAAGLNAVAKKNAHTRAWGDLGEKVRGQLAGAMESDAPAAAGAIEGKDIDGDWMEFAKDSGTKAVPRAEMPQIKAAHRGAMTNFMNARGIAHQEESVPAASLKPTQAEFSRKKVAQAKGYTDGDRSILISQDGHVLDGHHQWLAAREQGNDVRVIRLDAPIDELLQAAREFPSSSTSPGAAPSAIPGKGISARRAAKAQAAEAARADYFGPGNIVKSYGGHARVVSYIPADRDGRWSVTVRSVRPRNGKWVDVPGLPDRTHATEPDPRSLAAGPLVRASVPSGVTVNEIFGSEQRDDEKPEIRFRRGDSEDDAQPGGGMTLDQAEQLLRIMGRSPEISPAARAQAVAKVRTTVDAIRSAWANGPGVVVAFDMNDPAVPADARAEDLKQRSRGAAVAPQGFYWKGKTYLLASQLSTPNDAARVLFHESLGHHGLRGAFGKELDNILNQVVTMRRADVDAKIEEYGLRAGNAADRRLAAEEVLAEMAQATPQLHFVKRAIAAIRNWLRANVPGFRSLAMRDADIIQAFILPARRFVEQGARPQGGAPVLAFSRANEKSPAAQWVDASAKTDGFDLTSIRSAGGELSLAEGVERRNRGESGEAMFSRSTASSGIPDAIIGSTLGSASSHPDYAAAKAGDIEAAVRLAKQTVSPELVAKVRAAIGDAKPRVVPVAAEEAAGRNKIPRAAAEVLAMRLGLETAGGIVQANRAHRTGLDGLDRIFAPVDFAGAVEPGAYLLVDDTLTQGGTFAALASHIREGGGTVTGIIALTGKQYSATIQPSADTLATLRQKHGDLENEFRAATGYGFDALTQSEARYLARYEPAERLRDRILDEGRRGREREDQGNSGPGTVSDGPAFSRGKLSQFKTKAVDQIHAALSHPGTVSIWDKTVGTMYHLAERAPAFKPVFQAAQQFVDDVSSLATDAADAAPRILPKLEHWADLKKQPIAAADNRAIARPIFEGTLMWGRDEKGQPALVDDLAKAATSLTVDDKAQLLLRTGKLDAGVLKMWRGLPVGQYENMINSRFEAKHLKAGILWKPKELETHFKLTPQQVDLYREFRAGVDRSIDITARADMLRALGKEYAGLRDATLDAGTLQDALDLLTSTLLADAKASPDKSERLMQLHNQVVDRATQARELQDAGYAPLSRFGRYTVDVVDAAGERLYFGMFETKLEANKMKEAMAREFKGATVEQGTMSQQAFKLFQGITPESLELFGNMLGLKSEGDGAQDKAFQEYLKLTKNNHSAMKRLMHRKGITGYSEDVGRVLASFIYSNARQSAAGLNMGDLDAAINSVPKDQGELKDVAIGLRDYIKNPQEEAQAVRGLLFAQYLGGSVASAIVNMSQPFAVTFPWLSQFGGARKAAQQLGRAFKDMGTKGLQYEPELARALKNAEDSGVVSPQEVHQLMAQARGSGSLRSGDGTKAGDARAALGNKLAQFSLVWGKGFSMAEQINRRSTFIASFRLAQQQGMQDPAGFAAKAVVETQFLYNKANKMRWARGAVGGTLMTFKTYSIAYLELMQRMWTQGGPEGKKAVGMALVMLMLMGGAGGLPFAEDLEDVIDSLGQAMGYNISAKQWRKQAMREVLGDSLAEFMESGISGLPGSPVDVSGRLGMGNLLPGTGLMLTKRDSTRDLLEIVGPAGDFIKRGFAGAGMALSGLATGAQRALDGDLGAAAGAVAGGVGRGALEVSPGAVRNAAKGIDMAARGMYRDSKGYKVLDTTIAEALAKGIGFQPKSVAEVQEANSFMLRSKSFYTQNSSDIKAQWAKALFEKDESGLAQVRERLAAWNRNNPEQPIVVKMPDVWKKVREMGKDRTQRIADTAPKALRAQMRQEVAGLL